MSRRAWRVCVNPRSNDWNNEPEYIAVPYDIVGESRNGKSFLVERSGWHGKKHRHYIAKHEFFFTKEEAETASRKKTYVGFEGHLKETD